MKRKQVKRKQKRGGRKRARTLAEGATVGLTLGKAATGTELGETVGLAVGTAADGCMLLLCKNVGDGGVATVVI